VIDWLIVSEVFYSVTVILLKISLGLFFIRILTQKWQRLTIQTMMAVSTIYGAVMIIFAIFHCGADRDALSYLTKKLQLRCVSKSVDLVMMYTGGAVTTLTDCIFVFLPLFMLQKAQLTRREKATVAFIMLLGSA